MEKKKQIHGSNHLSLSNSIPQNLRFSSSRHPKTASFSLPIKQDAARRHFSDSFSSLALEDDNGDELPEFLHSEGNGPIVPPSDRFFVSPSTSASLAGDCDHHDHELNMNPTVVQPSDRFFISTSSSASLTDRTAQTDATSAKSPCTSSSLASDSTYAANQQEATSSSSTSSRDGAVLDGVPVSTYSKDPYEDFKSSMQEMMDCCHVDKSQPLDWDFMEDLLFCYIELNDRSVHRYIIKAFTDVIFPVIDDVA